MINILWSEISAKFRLLSINNWFVILNKKSIASFRLSWQRNLEKSEILMENSINLQNFKQI